MKMLKTTNTNEDILVDTDMFDTVNQYTWTKSSYGYAVRYTGSSRKRNRKLIWLHRFIMSPQKEEEVDHINHNKLDNRKCNLRLCNRQMNSFNNKSKRGNSKYKGVHLRKNGRYEASIMYDYKKIHLGYFTTEKGAALAYDIAAMRYFGEYAYLNFKDQYYVKKL